MEIKEPAKKISSRSLAGRLLLFAVAMFGFGYLLVPAYSLFCQVTGLGGRTNETAATVDGTPDESRSIDLEFVATVNQYAPWKFHPTVDEMSIHPGDIYEATFTATNLSDQPTTAQAIPSVAPEEAAKYFKKLQCFCWTRQDFKPNETRQLLVRFVVDPDLPEFVDTITLSYTFFDTKGLSDASG